MELVYAIPEELAPPPRWAVQPLHDAFFARINRAGRFFPRQAVEEDERWLQPIPYAVVGDGTRLFLTRRVGKSSERRLLGRASIGIGGHVNPEDLCREPVTWALFRELWEELGVRARRVRRLGLLRTDESPVARVHLGVLYLVEPEAPPRVRETEKLKGHLALPQEVEAAFERMEGWSQVAWRHLLGINLYSV